MSGPPAGLSSVTMSLPLHVGDHGPEVTDLRRRLAVWQTLHGDHPSLAPGPAFDQATADVVRRFQRARSLPADTVVGVETWTTLIEATRGLGDRLLWHSTALMRGDDVQDLQQRLNQLGFDAGPEDGLFGPLTGVAVTAFQEEMGLEVDGIVGPRTIGLLQALHRGHHASGVGTRVREEHDLRRLARRGLTGLQVMVDPSAPAATTSSEASDVLWQIGTRLSASLAAHGARPLLSRGPNGSPSSAERARLANRLDVDLVIVLSLNRNPSPVASGAAAYYYGSLRFVSGVGKDLASAMLDAVVTAGIGPDCRVHPMTWAILRETRMPVVVLEPGFSTSTVDMTALSDPTVQDRLVRGLTLGLRAHLLAVAD